MSLRATRIKQLDFLKELTILTIQIQVQAEYVLNKLFVREDCLERYVQTVFLQCPNLDVLPFIYKEK